MPPRPSLHSAAKSWIPASATALAYWACASGALLLTQGADGIATMWPASGILLASIILMPIRTACKAAVFCAAASLIANVGAGISAANAFAYTASNIIEAVTGAILWQRLGGERTLFLGWRDVARFCGAAFAAATCSAALAWTLTGRPGNLFVVSWFATVLLGMLIVTPVILVVVNLVRSSFISAMPKRSQLAAAGTLFALAVVTAASFWQSTYPLLFVPLIALLAVTYQLRVFGAASGVLVIATVASAFSSKGYGPVTLMRGSLDAKSFFLQIYLLAMFATALPLAALLASRERLTSAYKRSERMHRLLAEASSDIVVRFSMDGTPLYVSAAAKRILGYDPSEMIARGALRDIHPDDRPAVLSAWARTYSGVENEVCIYRQRCSDGREVWLEAAYRVADAQEAGGSAEIVAIVRDVTHRRLNELAAAHAVERVQEANKMLADAEAVAHLGHWRIDLVDGTIRWSEEIKRIHERPGPPPSHYGQALSLYHAGDQERIQRIVQEALRLGGAFAFEARLITGSGELRHVASRGQVKHSAAGTPVALFGTLQDITEWVRIERELDRARLLAEEATARALLLADTDALTGVASRRKAMAVLEDSFAAARSGTRNLAVAIFDVDHFKRVNDEHGHATGDAVLVQIAQAVAGALNPGDLIGRLGGEEFVLITQINGDQEATRMADRVRMIVMEAFEAQPTLPRVTVSIGAATYRGEANPTDLLQAADRALYAAKHAGRNATRLAA